MGYVAILGATGSIGRTLARRLVQDGQAVLLVGRNQDRLHALAEELHQSWVSVDCFDSSSLELGLRNVNESLGGLSGIVNCIGSLILRPAHLTSDDDFRRTVETNLFTAFATVRVGVKFLRADGGSIVLFASAAAEIGIHNHEAIAAAKGGVIGLGRSAAATYASNNIRVNVISPGLIRTDLTRDLWENTTVASASERLHPLGRLGEPEHVASLAAWLLDSKNNWMTGQVLGIDGGLAHVVTRQRIAP